MLYPLMARLQQLLTLSDYPQEKNTHALEQLQCVSQSATQES
jgi:hypothetical protein